MAQIFQTTLVPAKLELIGDWLVRQPWYRGLRSPQLQPVGGYRLDDPAGEVGMEFHFVRDTSNGPDGPVYQVPVTYRGAPADEAGARLIGTTEHGVLGTRWVYDGAHDPVLVAELVALAVGRAQAQHQHESDRPEPTVTARWTGVAPSSSAIRQVEDGGSSTVVTLDSSEPHELRIVRVLDGSTAEPPSRAGDSAGDSGGIVSAEWAAADGTRVVGPVALLT